MVSFAQYLKNKNAAVENAEVNAVEAGGACADGGEEHLQHLVGHRLVQGHVCVQR